MARLIKPDGTEQQVQPANGVEFTLDEMKSYVEGYLEAIKLTATEVMYFNEEGIRLRLPYNQRATLLLHMHRQEHKYSRLLGNVLVASLQETGDTEE